MLADSYRNYFVSTACGIRCFWNGGVSRAKSGQIMHPTLRNRPWLNHVVNSVAPLHMQPQTNCMYGEGVRIWKKSSGEFNIDPFVWSLNLLPITPTFGRVLWMIHSQPSTVEVELMMLYTRPYAHTSSSQPDLDNLKQGTVDRTLG